MSVSLYLAHAWVGCRRAPLVATLLLITGIISCVVGLLWATASSTNQLTNTRNELVEEPFQQVPALLNERAEEEAAHVEQRLDMAIQEAKSLLTQTLKPIERTVPSIEELKSRQVLSKEEEDAERKKGFEANRFEQFVSDRISLHRNLPDPRSHFCLDQKFDIDKLPNTSVIIVFHNEARSTLLRTVWSVLDKSPKELIHEIILVDDASTMEHLHEKLSSEVLTIPKTRIVRLPARSGLIRAKVAGAEAATGEVLTFLDSHCECHFGWLLPLLDRIRISPSNVPVPTIDSIDKSTFKYLGGPETTTRGIFSWTLTFTWLDLPYDKIQARKSVADPLPSPTMAGGLFSIQREYFWKVGSYDMGMDVWGGENLEMSFRIWGCGGRIEILPCSRVGHVFRDRHPYKFPDGAAETINRNLNRVAEVWMDEYKEIYYELRPSNRVLGAGNITDRLELRKNLNCKPFKWYLDHVFPDMFVPLRENVAGRGVVRNAASSQCLDAGSSDAEKMVPKLVRCTKDAPGNMASQEFFLWKKMSQLRIETDFSNRCLDSSHREAHGALEFWGCHGMKGNQEFTYTQDLQIQHVPSNTCLTAWKNGTNWTPVIDPCDVNNKLQTWTFSKWHDY